MIPTVSTESQFKTEPPAADLQARILERRACERKQPATLPAELRQALAALPSTAPPPPPCPALGGPIGSSWDATAGPDATDPRHLAEWVDGSACHPALAAANLQSLTGREVLEALVGDRLEALGGWAQQYATGAVARLLRPLEPVAAAGGWWCSGLDPLADWAPMEWGQFKPDAPRRDADGEALKYEAPWRAPTRSTWLRVPAAVAQLVADRHRLSLPAEVAADSTGSAGAFWRWWARTPALPLLVTEGVKKAAALLSQGIPAVSLPGIDSGAKRNGPAGIDGRRSGPLELIPDLARLPLKGRRVWVLFDHSTKATPREPIAAERLARLLSKAGARQVLAGTVPGTHGKGADDHLAGGGTWEQLARCLQPLAARPVLPQLRAADLVAPAGQWLGDACPIPSPEEARLVALAAPMGAGKSQAIAAAVAPHQATGRPVVLLTHRRHLGASNAADLGLPWADDALPGSDLRLQGIALCLDSLRPGSAVRFRASDWAGAVVVLDEAAQLLEHALFSSATAVGDHRPEVLEQLQQLLSTASQVICADAQLADHHLQALETATGARALLIGSEHQPAAGRQTINHPSRASWRRELVGFLQARLRLWIATTAQQVGSKNSAQVLERLALKHWPGCRVLRVDSETIADPAHDASRLADDPNGIAGRYDVVVCTPAVAAGLSVDRLPGHFAAVMVAAGGTTDPAAVAQAAARVRDGCPRHLYAPEASPGNARRIGCGSFDPVELQRHGSRHGAAILAQLGGSVDMEAGTAGPWLPLWHKLAAISNQQAAAYGATVRGLLQREGYELVEAGALDPLQAAEAAAIGAELEAISDDAQAAEDAAVMTAELLSDREAQAIGRKRRRTPAELAQLARWRISKAWGLGPAAPSPEVIEADRERLSQRLRFGHTLQSLEARQLQARADHATAARISHHGKAWAPDLCRELVGPRITAADRLGLPAWLSRGDTFTADDPALIRLQATATAAANDLRQALGVSPAKTGTGTLRRLLRLTGHRLEAHRCRTDGERAWRYRVVAEPLPDGATAEQLQQAWVEQLQQEAAPAQLSQKIPFTYGEG